MIELGAIYISPTGRRCVAVPDREGHVKFRYTDVPGSFVLRETTAEKIMGFLDRPVSVAGLVGFQWPSRRAEGAND